MSKEILWLERRIGEVENILPGCSPAGRESYEPYLVELREKWANLTNRLCPLCAGKGYV